MIISSYRLGFLRIHTNAAPMARVVEDNVRCVFVNTFGELLNVRQHFMEALILMESIVDSKSKGIQFSLHGMGIIFRIFQVREVFTVDRVSDNECEPLGAAYSL